MRTLILFLFSIFILNTTRSGAQIIASNDTAIGCTDTITLSATVGAATGTSISLSDDVYSGVINIGFPFTWYGVTYTQCVISSNNYITFGTANANMGSPWSITTSVPSSVNPVNAAMGPWQDINPGVGGTVRYATLGVTPNRIFVVEYCNIPMFSCTNLQFSSQIQLHENGNLVETHIISKPLCNSWNSGQAVHATHNINGTQATVVAGRNAGAQWITSNEGYRFTPVSATAYTASAIPFAPVIIGSAPSSVIWTANGVQVGTGTSITVTPGTTTSYIASVSGGCSGITFADTVVVSVPPAPPNISINATRASGSTIHENCDSSVVTYTRANPAVTDTLVINVTGTATNGTDYPFIPDTVIMPPGMTSFSYTISAFPDGLAEGMESVSVNAKLLHPCITTTVSYTLFLNDLPPIIVTTTNDTTVCPGSQVFIEANATGGVFGYPLIYSWSNGVNDSMQTVLPTATTTYVVTVTDSCGITVTTDSVTITVMPPLFANAGPDQTMCAGDSVILYGTGATIFNWTPATGLSSSTVAQPVARPATTTTYHLETSDGVCFDNDSVTITVNQKPVVTATPQDTLICLSNSVTLTGQGAVNYTWAPTNSLSSPTGTNVIASPTVTTTYNVVGFDQNQCKDTTSVTIFVNPPLYLTAFGDTTLCADSVSAELSAYGTGGNGGPYTYTWSPDIFLSSNTGSNVTASPTESMVYTVTLTDNCGTPAATDSVVISILPIPDIEVIPSVTSGCEPLLVQFNNLTQDIASASWSFGNGHHSSEHSPAHNFTQYGQFETSVLVTNQYGCQARFDSIFIDVWPNPVAEIEVSPGHTDMINPVVYFADNGMGSSRWYWEINGNFSDSAASFFHRFEQPGTYPITLYVENDYGCSDDAISSVTIDGVFQVYAPNAFTPDGNGNNDVFRVVADGASVFKISIYNRWGELVFQSDNPDIGWDGTYNGRPAPMGVYVYKLHVEGAFPNTTTDTDGIITLIR